MEATGEDGFEGLMQVVLTEVTGIPFRLSAAGSQYGRDGSAAYPEDGVCFECKRYRGPIPRDKILAKLAELSLEPSIDLFVLCATVPVGAQLSDTVRRIGLQQGLSVCVLDWSGELPPLAVALALASRTPSDGQHKEALAGLEALRRDSRFEASARRLRRELQEPTVGVAAAAAANHRWLMERFSDAGLARDAFGTRLAPFDPKFGEPYIRKRLVERVRDFLGAESREERVLWVTGAEGTGKSWLVAQAWAGLDEKPLMVALSPADFVGDLAPEELLIRALVKQRGKVAGDGVAGRWRRKFVRWRRQGGRSGPAIVAVIDGLNERQKVDWPRRIDGIMEDLESLNVRLIATVRSEYFKTEIKGRLDYEPNVLAVVGWRESERDDILTRSGALPPGLVLEKRHHDILTALCNPRLLGIAMELLANRQVRSFDELGVSRLLLEHMRASERDGPDPQPFRKYARRLREHAERVVQRIKDGVEDDVKVFEDVETIADGRFFVALQDEPGRYKLSDGALVLALGFSIVDTLRIARRNDRDPWAVLEKLMDPIASLDDVANVVEAALAISAIMEDGDALAGPLVSAFMGLQNRPLSLLPACRRWARAWPKAFLDAARQRLVAGEHVVRLDWLEDGLYAARAEPDVWSVISATVCDWLSSYPRRATEDVAKPEELRWRSYSFDWACVSPGEESLLGEMRELPEGAAALSAFALRLIAGRNLAPFAKGLVQVAFARHLEEDARFVGGGLVDLVRFNRSDWRETRDALRREQRVLEGADVSLAGKWALVTLLRATGDAEDAQAAAARAIELTGHRQRMESSRSSHPCDPSASRPADLDGAVERYQKVDLERLRPFMGHTEEDWTLRRFLPALARFAPGIAAETYRSFARHVVSRDGHPLWLGMSGLQAHASILGRELAFELLTASQLAWVRAGSAEELGSGDREMAAQYAELLAFPYLTSREQLEWLSEIDDERGVLRKLLPRVKSPDPEDLAGHLETAYVAGRETEQCVLLTLAESYEVGVVGQLRARLPALMESPNEAVRAEALGVVEYLEDSDLVARLAAGDWTGAASPRTSRETLFGSLVLIRAAAEGLLRWRDVLLRIPTWMYDHAIERGGQRVAGMVATLFRGLFDFGGELAVDLGSGQGEASGSRQGRKAVRLTETGDPDVGAALPDSGVAAVLGSLDEGLGRDRGFVELARSFSSRRPEFSMVPPSLEALDEIVRTRPELADQWVEWFCSAPDSHVSSLKGIGLSLAHAIRRDSAGRTAELLKRLKGSGEVRPNHLPSGLLLEALVSWTVAETEDIVELCFDRLDEAGTDHDIAREVQTAMVAGRDALLSRFVEERWAREEPEAMARALTVVGFSRPEACRQRKLEKMQVDDGMVGVAWRAARDAWDHDQWARHWFGKMCAARCRLGFWRYSVLLARVVDGRFRLWRSDYDESSEFMELFGPSVWPEIDSRLKRWQEKRHRTLLGGSVPARAFLPTSQHGG